MALRTFQGITPQLGEGAYVDESAVVCGDVLIGAHSSIWPMTVVRGDVNRIRIGTHTNIQDGSVLHVTHGHGATPEGFGLSVGNHVTVGHKVILHGCTIKDLCLIGMGSTVMDGAVVESGVLLAAGSLVSEGKVLEGGYLWVGSPARRMRPLTPAERDWFNYSAQHYVRLKDQYRQ